MKWFMIVSLFLGGEVHAQQPNGELEQRRTAVVQAVEKVAPAVVSITIETQSQDPFAWMTGRESASSEGSGVVIDASQGIVLTNAHVVENAATIQVSFANKNSQQANVIGIAPELDLAVLQLSKTRSLQAVRIGSSANLLLGEPVIAIGNPFGLGHTVTTGIISSIDRPLETKQRVYQNFIQTDASINPGNSGGPLLNIHGELIGINTAIRANAEGIGFAIPVDRAMKVAKDLLNYGAVQIPWLGIDLTDVIFRYRGQRLIAPKILYVHRGTAAAQAGVQAGDLLLKVDGKEIQGRSDLNAYLSALTTGKTVGLLLWRNGRTLSVSIKSAKVPATVVQHSIKNILGIEVREKKGFGVELVRLSPRGSFSQYRLRAGDVIIAFNGMPIRSLRQFKNALLQSKSEHKAEGVFTIWRRGARGQIELAI